MLSGRSDDVDGDGKRPWLGGDHRKTRVWVVARLRKIAARVHKLVTPGIVLGILLFWMLAVLLVTRSSINTGELSAPQGSMMSSGLGRGSSTVSPCALVFWALGFNARVEALYFLGNAGGPFLDFLRIRNLSESEFCIHIVDSDASPPKRTIPSILEGRGALRLFEVGAHPARFKQRTWLVLIDHKGKQRRVRSFPLEDFVADSVGSRTAASVMSLRGTAVDVAEIIRGLRLSGTLCRAIDRIHIVVDAKFPAVQFLDPDKQRTDLLQQAAPMLQHLQELEEDEFCRFSGYSVEDKDGSLSEYTAIHSRPELRFPWNDPGRAFYAIRGGNETLQRRISASKATWLRSLPALRFAVFVQHQLSPPEQETLHGLQVLERHSRYGSARKKDSILKRIEVGWDRFMSREPMFDWLVLIPDDTFLFLEGLEDQLSRMDSSLPIWLGAPHGVPVDLGDEVLGRSWRMIHLQHGGENCTLPGEELRVGVSNCSNLLCRGCPPSPSVGLIVLSRTMVSALRPVVDHCESFRGTYAEEGPYLELLRLYVCINRLVLRSKFISLEGFHHASWLRDVASHVSSGGDDLGVVTLGIYGFEAQPAPPLVSEFWKLHSLKRRAEARHLTLSGSRYVSDQDVLDLFLCNGTKTWQTTECA
mmetsp:Transcript_12587/g.25537  ORF Transcript_12587/g.25537 Transcript_12587/m.25537 type:complete len:645 (+) Transcript_12587:4074-6008(+)